MNWKIINNNQSQCNSSECDVMYSVSYIMIVSSDTANSIRVSTSIKQFEKKTNKD